MIKILLILLLIVSCQSANDSFYQPPTDLRIINPVWTRSDPRHIYGETEFSEHDFTIQNVSDQFVYDQIIVRFSYFDRQHRLLHQALHKIWHELKPHEFYRAKGMGGGAVKPGTYSASVSLVKAVKKRQRQPVQ